MQLNLAFLEPPNPPRASIDRSMESARSGSPRGTGEAAEAQTGDVATQLDPNDKVVLIGYSGGGFAITRIADTLNGNPPHKIDLLIAYVRVYRNISRGSPLTASATGRA